MNAAEISETLHANADIARMLQASMSIHVERERNWLPHDRRGRWVVMEPGPGRYLTDSPARVRRYVDAVTPRRARRFSSLSRAKAFAREVGGTVRRWRRTPPSGGCWRRKSPWEQARESVKAMNWMIGGGRR